MLRRTNNPAAMSERGETTRQSEPARLANRFQLPSSKHPQTPFIKIVSRRCQACWKCIEVCPNQVLGKVDFLGHRHVRIDDAAACNGCKKCVRICPDQAIDYIYEPLSAQPHLE
jgi:NAD-dependent dihydropyrimidine dehydrogenase PreA subunit